MTNAKQKTPNPITFSTDGIRGISGKWPFTNEGIGIIGSALVKFISRDKVNKPFVFLGRDTRPSGRQYSKIIKSYLLAGGIKVIDLGIAPTPAVAYLTRKYSAQLGIVVSASHNPEKYNGIKLVDFRGLRLQPDIEKQIEKMMLDLLSGASIKPTQYKDVIGTSHGLSTKTKQIFTGSQSDYMNEYIEDHVEMLGDESLSGLRLIIDCANGAVSQTGKRLLSGLGVSVTSLNDDISGKARINNNCGSEYYREFPDELIEIVKQHDADYGLAFDGDGDRIVVADSENFFYNGDDLLYALARIYSNKAALPKNTVVIAPNTNSGLKRSLNNIGIHTITTENGDKNLEAEIWKNNFLLGAEQVGNIIINDGKHGAADSLYAITLLFTLLKKVNKTLNELVTSLTKDAQVQALVHTAERIPESDIQRVINEVKLDKASELDNRILYWHSSTEPGLFNFMVEIANSEDAQAAISFAKKFLDKVSRFIKEEPKIIDISTRKRK